MFKVHLIPSSPFPPLPPLPSPPSVLPWYLRLGGPPGLIHWKIVAAWLKTKDLSDWMLMLTSITRYFRDKITQ